MVDLPTPSAAGRRTPSTCSALWPQAVVTVEVGRFVTGGRLLVARVGT